MAGLADLLLVIFLIVTGIGLAFLILYIVFRCNKGIRGLRIASYIVLPFSIATLTISLPFGIGFVYTASMYYVAPSDFTANQEIVITEDGFKLKNTGEEFTLLYTLKHYSLLSVYEQKEYTNEPIYSYYSNNGLNHSGDRNVYKLTFDGSDVSFYTINASYSYRKTRTSLVPIVDIYAKNSEINEVKNYYESNIQWDIKDEFKDSIKQIIQKNIKSEPNEEADTFVVGSYYRIFFRGFSTLFNTDAYQVGFVVKATDDGSNNPEYMYVQDMSKKEGSTNYYNLTTSEAEILRNYYKSTHTK